MQRSRSCLFVVAAAIWLVAASIASMHAAMQYVSFGTASKNKNRFVQAGSQTKGRPARTLTNARLTTRDIEEDYEDESLVSASSLLGGLFGGGVGATLVAGIYTVVLWSPLLGAGVCAVAMLFSLLFRALAGQSDESTTERHETQPETSGGIFGFQFGGVEEPKSEKEVSTESPLGFFGFGKHEPKTAAKSRAAPSESSNWWSGFGTSEESKPEPMKEESSGGFFGFGGSATSKTQANTKRQKQTDLPWSGFGAPKETEPEEEPAGGFFGFGGSSDTKKQKKAKKTEEAPWFPFGGEPERVSKVEKTDEGLFSFLAGDGSESKHDPDREEEKDSGLFGLKLI